jgi:hypothetical protein
VKVTGGTLATDASRTGGVRGAIRRWLLDDKASSVGPAVRWFSDGGDDALG